MDIAEKSERSICVPGRLCLISGNVKIYICMAATTLFTGQTGTDFQNRFRGLFTQSSIQSKAQRGWMENLIRILDFNGINCFALWKGDSKVLLCGERSECNCRNIKSSDSKANFVVALIVFICNGLLGLEIGTLFQSSIESHC